MTTLPTEYFESQPHWAQWLARHHATSRGVWLQFAKKGAGVPTVSYEEAIEVALCFGWIDGQKQKHADPSFWLQKFTPRASRSGWSRINRDKAQALIACGKMQPAGLAQIERARSDGRWDAAYDPASRATVPEDLRQALEGNSRARDFFETLDGRNRYAILYRIQTVKKADTRARKIAEFVQLLARGEKVHP